LSQAIFAYHTKLSGLSDGVAPGQAQQQAQAQPVHLGRRYQDEALRWAPLNLAQRFPTLFIALEEDHLFH
jgi:hypothetical protein